MSIEPTPQQLVSSIAPIAPPPHPTPPPKLLFKILCPWDLFTSSEITALEIDTNTRLRISKTAYPNRLDLKTILIRGNTHQPIERALEKVVRAIMLRSKRSPTATSAFCTVSLVLPQAQAMMLAIDEEKGINVLLNVLKIDTNKLTPDIELDPESSCQFRERLLHISASDARTLTLSTIEAYRFLLLFFNRRIDYEYEGIEYHYALSQVKVTSSPMKYSPLSYEMTSPVKTSDRPAARNTSHSSVHASIDMSTPSSGSKRKEHMDGSGSRKKAGSESRHNYERTLRDESRKCDAPSPGSVGSVGLVGQPSDNTHARALSFAEDSFIASDESAANNAVIFPSRDVCPSPPKQVQVVETQLETQLETVSSVSAIVTPLPSPYILAPSAMPELPEMSENLEDLLHGIDRAAFSRIGIQSFGCDAQTSVEEIRRHLWSQIMRAVANR